MGKVIAISNHKGGVGKTTSAINFGAALARSGKKVLLIDFDPQSNLSQSLEITEPEIDIYSIIKGDKEANAVKLNKNLYMIPAVSSLGAAEIELAAEAGREYILSEILDDIKDDYDYIIIDCPPSLGLLTINAFTAADEVLIPMQAEFLALQGIGKLLGLVEKIKKRLNERLTIAGIFITQFDRRKVLNRHVLNTIEGHFGDKVYNTTIRNNVALAEAPNSGLDIFEYNENSNGAFDYKMFTKEYLKREKNGA
ncbi:MAG: ParA family protein [Bacteroidales bacterium]